MPLFLRLVASGAGDKEMVDGEGLTGFLRGLGQPFVMREHIDERRFAHVASSDKRIFRQLMRRTFLYVRTGYYVTGLMNRHIVGAAFVYLSTAKVLFFFQITK